MEQGNTGIKNLRIKLYKILELILSGRVLKTEREKREERRGKDKKGVRKNSPFNRSIAHWPQENELMNFFP